jgi:DNA ligase-1
MFQIIDDHTVLNYLKEQGLVNVYKTVRQGLGSLSPSPHYLAGLLEVPPSLCFALEALFQEEASPAANALDSISLFSLCKGLFLPLSGMSSSKIASLFGFYWEGDKVAHRELVAKFLAEEMGLALSEKIAYLMGDPFTGQNSYMGQDTLIQVLCTIRLASPDRLREKLPQLGDVGALFVEETNLLRSEPPITAREAILILKHLPQTGINEKKRILGDLLLRAGRLERYFLVRLILRRLNFGYDYRRDSIVQALAAQYRIPDQTVENGVALSDIFHVAVLLEKEGEAGLKKLVLKPLNPVSPALAGTMELGPRTAFPLWVECKYDGIRLMLHKDTSPGGHVKYAAFTRRKYDWLELAPGLAASGQWIPGRSFILDGELHGKVLDMEGKGFREATVYQIYRYLQGDTQTIVRLQYVVFDILYWNGQDLTGLPFRKRREFIERLIAPLAQTVLPVPLLLSQGWEVSSLQDLKKWYQYFRNQGHEGLIAKLPDSVYSLGKRTQDWLKKKEAMSLDLVLSGALWAIGDCGPKIFSAYLLSCWDEQRWREIGSAQGLSQEQNFSIIQRIASECLLTGRSLEMRSASGIHTGIELVPGIVVTVRFEDVIRDSEGKCSLRDPKIVCIRPRGDTSPEDIDTYDTIRQLHLKKSLH